MSSRTVSREPLSLNERFSSLRPNPPQDRERDRDRERSPAVRSQRGSRGGRGRGRREELTRPSSRGVGKVRSFPATTNLVSR